MRGLKGQGAERHGANVILRNLSIAALFLMVVAMLGLLATRSLFAHSPAAVVVQAAAVALMVWARLTFGLRSFHAAANPTKGGLVTTGPYRFIRHPIYTAVCLFGWAGVLSNWSAPAAGFGVLLLAGSIGRMLCEERLVLQMYPEYRQYARSTKRMVPRVF
ncbi:MAG: methyltransferase family protein [Acidobacteriota bacterium]